MSRVPSVVAAASIAFLPSVAFADTYGPASPDEIRRMLAVCKIMTA
jgi:hypothetical protein